MAKKKSFKIFVIVGIICLLAGIIILSILLANCPNAGCPTGQYCRGECPNAGCPTGQYCRGECPECKVCKDSNQVCSSNKCVDCISDKDCPSSLPNTPKLHCTQENTCQQCNGGEAGDFQCGGVFSNSEKPYCGKDGTCYACIAEAGYRGQCLNWEQFFGVMPGISDQCIKPLGTCTSRNQCFLTGIRVNPNFACVSSKYIYLISNSDGWEVLRFTYPEIQYTNLKDLVKNMFKQQCIVAAINSNTLKINKCYAFVKTEDVTYIYFKNLAAGESLVVVPFCGKVGDVCAEDGNCCSNYSCNMLNDAQGVCIQPPNNCDLKNNCNVCKECCQSYITNGTVCDNCVKAQCA